VIAMFAWNPMLLLETRVAEGLLRYPICCLGKKRDGLCDIILWSLEDGIEYAQFAGVSTLLGLTELVVRGVVTFKHAADDDDACLEELAHVMTYICGEQPGSP
jgi:hypothetical protein